MNRFLIFALTIASAAPVWAQRGRDQMGGPRGGSFRGGGNFRPSVSARPNFGPSMGGVSSSVRAPVFTQPSVNIGSTVRPSFSTAPGMSSFNRADIRPRLDGVNVPNTTINNNRNANVSRYVNPGVNPGANVDRWRGDGNRFDGNRVNNWNGGAWANNNWNNNWNNNNWTNRGNWNQNGDGRWWSANGRYGSWNNGAWYGRYQNYHNDWHHGSWRWNNMPWFWAGMGLWGGYGLSYYNPYAYYADPGYYAPIDYSMPLPAPVTEAVVAPGVDESTSLNIRDAMNLFQVGRSAYKNGDYQTALHNVDTAIALLPSDPALHEFRALTLFALGRYHDAAATVYAVLSAGPGSTWDTVSGLYGDPSAYTSELRALEGYINQNPADPATRFLLAYQYLVIGDQTAAANQFLEVTRLSPSDNIAAELYRSLSASNTANVNSSDARTPPPPPVPAAVPNR